MRARVETELLHAGHAYDDEVVRVGRVRDRHYESYEAFRAHAMPRLGFDRDTPPLAIASLPETPEVGEAVRLAVLEFCLAVFWSVKSHIGSCGQRSGAERHSMSTGPLIESLIALDRYFYLVEGLKGSGRVVELYALFDQDVGSLRNLALAVREGEGEGAPPPARSPGS
jgi:hypothetical protein